MKLFFAITIIVLNSALGLGQVAEFQFKKDSYKFPDTKEGVVLEHEFELTNTGSIPFLISDYKVACPCTKVILPKNPIRPGETYRLKVTFDTKGKYYYQDRSIYLSTNTKKGTERIRIKVNVIPESEPINH
ncbi:MAG: DUF1573 domain-containing protein [Crocinitomicaceae bacterium]|mgnify:CR=1 FL=1|jgi:hypothetical protein|nr:DUF1573 domain-containing protein [Crocinitomicaceae bacterium]